MTMRLTVGTHSSGQTTWWLCGQNNRVVAWAGRTFDSVTEAAQSAFDFKMRAATAEVDIDAEACGSWRWRTRHAQQQLAVSANGFTTKQNARRAAENVRANAYVSSGPYPRSADYWRGASEPILETPSG
jgi:uncharacterized protein YegP (UPF0339 family)